MDLHHTPSHAPVRDVEPISADAVYPSPDADVRIAEREREEKALGALETQIMELWGNVNAATARFLELVAEFDRREGWAQHGMASCAQWLNWQCGIGRVAATEKVRTVRGFRKVKRYLERDEAEAMHEQRYLSWRQDSDGSVRIEARLTPEVGEMLRKALEAAHAQLDERDADTEGGGRRGSGQRRGRGRGQGCRDR